MNIMLDLETMGSGPDAAIVAIGAVEFDPESNALGRTFYCNVDLNSAIADGGVLDADTVVWWLGQDYQARISLLNDTTKIQTALVDFAYWLKVSTEAIIWGNGATFDNVILAQAYKRSAIERPWSHRNDRCYRTLKAMHPDIVMERVGIHHNALDDAISQAKHALKILA